MFIKPFSLIVCDFYATEICYNYFFQLFYESAPGETAKNLQLTEAEGLKCVEAFLIRYGRKLRWLCWQDGLENSSSFYKPHWGRGIRIGFIALMF